jgi:hypothetical protein
MLGVSEFSWKYSAFTDFNMNVESTSFETAIQ